MALPIVRSLAGRDKDELFCVVGAEGAYLLLCDGKRRRVERPKRKKLFHLAPTATVLPEEALRTNRQIRSALRRFAGSAENA